MAPFDLVGALGKFGAYGIYLLIGVGFGAALEMAGFANARKLANQFYLKDMTVLKVMFTGIVTAMVLIFLTSAAGLLAFNDVYVPPTYLWPGILGGLIMGVGFILGGFCPGTSLVAVASLKVDGFLFLIGTMAGVFVFGETVALFDGFWYSSYLGRFLLPDLLGLSTGATVLLVVAVALGAFWLAEKAERAFGDVRDVRARRAPVRLAGAAALAVLALVVTGMGQPTPMQKYEAMDGMDALLERREVQIDAGELVQVATNRQIRLNLLDVRSERDFNLFHLLDARRVEMEALERGRLTRELLDEPANTVTVLVSNDEVGATRAWKLLTGEGIMNVYILEGGINGWLDRFAVDGACEGCRRVDGPVADDELAWRFEAALGATRPIADPDLFADMAFDFETKVELEAGERPAGGCG
ncbi:MAG: YeeE/YedE thiosulfate transporter family protein [Gemmatimonadota bacterium]